MLYYADKIIAPCVGAQAEVGPMAKRKLSTNEKIFYVVSLLIIISMVLSLLVGVFTPTNF
jgi:cell division protein FtsL